MCTAKQETIYHHLLLLSLSGLQLLTGGKPGPSRFPRVRLWVLQSNSHVDVLTLKSVVTPAALQVTGVGVGLIYGWVAFFPVLFSQEKEFT